MKEGTYVDVAYENPLEYLGTIEALLIRAKRNKENDGADSSAKRRWAIVYTELEKVKAYIQTFLMEEDSEG